jgi:hypothetical protein
LYNTSEAELDLIVENVVTHAALTGYNVSIKNLANNLWTNYTNVTSVPKLIYLNATNYTIYVWASGYQNYSVNISLSCKEHNNLNLSLLYYATFFIYDEKTLDGFNMSSPNAVYFHLFCPNSTTITLLTTNATTIPITCEFIKFRFILDYGTTSYYRTYLLEDSSSIGTGPETYDIFLIDARTTSYVTNNFIIDDLMDEYENISIWVYKWIGATKVHITSDEIDIESKVTAFLIKNHEYILEVHSTNRPVRIIGNYVAAEDGDKALKLYAINLDPTSESEINNVHVSMGAGNFTNETDNSTDLWVQLYVEGSSYIDEDLSLYNLTSINYCIMEDNCNSVPFYCWTTTDTSLMALDIFHQYNVTSRVNKTLCSNVSLQYTNSAGALHIVSRTKVVHTGITSIQQEIFDFVSHPWMNWLLVILLGTIAITSTVRTANYAALAIALIGALLAMFGWFAVGLTGTKVGTILVVAIVIALISIFKQKESNVL